MTAQDRREPILDEQEIPDGVEPLLLQDLVREGLPPPLWRRSTKVREEEATAKEEEFPPSPPDPVPAITSDMVFTGSMTKVEDLPPLPADSDPNPAVTPVASATVSGVEELEAEKSMEETELAKALEKIRKISFHYPAEEEKEEQAEDQRPEPPIAPSAPENMAHDEAVAVESHAPISSLSADQETTQYPAAYAETPATHQDVPETEPRPEDNPQSEARQSTATPASDTTSTTPSLLDGEFLREFETLLFQEVERRIIIELEEKITQHLQKAWKEQVSLAIMRGLALEGIRLRETVAREIQTAVPEILARVLHEGLDEALTSNLPEDAPPSTAP